MTITTGWRVPDQVRLISLADAVRYGGATWDWHRIHYDDAYARGHGLAAAVVDGQLFGALFIKLIQDALGPACFVEELNLTYRNPMFVGDRIRIGGTVTQIVGPQALIQLEAVVLASPRGGERAAVADATAVVAIDRIDGKVA